MNALAKPLGAGHAIRRGSAVAAALLVAAGLALAVGIDTLKIRGTIIGPDGKGLAKTPVKLIPAGEDFTPDPALTVLTLKTNRKGRFTAPFVKPGRYLLEIDAEGLAPHHVRIQMRDADRRIPVLADGTRIEDVDADVDPATSEIQLAIPPDVIDVRIEVTMGEPPQAAPAVAGGPEMELGEEIQEAREIYEKIQAGQIDEALAELDALMAEHPDMASLHEMRGYGLLKKGDGVSAEPEFRKAVELDPEIPGGWGLLGTVLAQNGKFEEAVIAIREQLNRSEDPAERGRLQLLLGQVLLELDRADEAIPPLEEALTLRPDDPEVKIQLVDAYTRAGREEDAEKLIGNLSDSAAARLHYNLAANYLRQKRWQEGIAHMRKAVELDPALTTAWRYIAEAQAAEGDLAAAKASYEKYLETTPDAEDADIVRQIIAAYDEALRGGK